MQSKADIELNKIESSTEITFIDAKWFSDNTLVRITAKTYDAGLLEVIDSIDIIFKDTKKRQKRTLEKLEIENKVKDQQILEMKPKVSYYDLILQCKSLLSTTSISKDYGMSATEFNKLLHNLGVQYCQGGVWFLYQRYADKGYTQTKTHNYSKSDGTQGAKPHTYWTQKGRLFLYDFLKEHGYLPTIEREEN